VGSLSVGGRSVLVGGGARAGGTSMTGMSVGTSSIGSEAESAFTDVTTTAEELSIRVRRACVRACVGLGRAGGACVPGVAAPVGVLAWH
jgi:hypothetical protein